MKFFLLRHIFLVFLFVFSPNLLFGQEHRSIPFNPDFPRAQYPYAQAPDGCSGWSDPSQVRDTWGPVSFVSACNSHDRCYYTAFSDVEVCNQRFLEDLLAACEFRFREELAKINQKDFQGNSLGSQTESINAIQNYWGFCISLAYVYHAGAVKGVDLGYFEEAQSFQLAYEEWVNQLP